MILTLKNNDLEKLIDVCDKNYIDGSSKFKTKCELALALSTESDASELKLKKKDMAFLKELLLETKSWKDQDSMYIVEEVLRACKIQKAQQLLAEAGEPEMNYRKK